ncbi:transposase, partial [Arthrospira platensis SPKY2]
GFSKDNKSQQPQIVVALMVTKEGFPIAYEVFKGSTFEGHTIIPVVESFIKKHQVKHFTVVADAAMISTDNIKALVKSNIHYIVGARLGNLSAAIIDQIDKELPRKDGSLLRFKTNNGYLICSFSTLRYRKDGHEMQKQIERAKLAIAQPSKNKKLKFTKSKNEKVELN